MSYEDYEAALGDLKRDADAWSELSQTFASVQTLVEGCAMRRYEMDGVGHMVGAEDNYISAHTAFSDLTGQATSVFDQIAEKLLTTKRYYEEADGYSQWLLDQS
jgi:DNA-binding ferritin-like protein